MSRLHRPIPGALIGAAIGLAVAAVLFWGVM